MTALEWSNMHRASDPHIAVCDRIGVVSHAWSLRPTHVQCHFHEKQFYKAHGWSNAFQFNRRPFEIDMKASGTSCLVRLLKTFGVSGQQSVFDVSWRISACDNRISVRVAQLLNVCSATPEVLLEIEIDGRQLLRDSSY